MRSLAHRLKNTIIYYAVVAMLGALRRLPLSWLLSLRHCLGFWAWTLGRRERTTAFKNVSLIYPALPEREKRELVRNMFSHLAQSALECVAMDKLRPSFATPQSPVRFEAGTLELLNAALDEKKGILFVTAHLGNWELMAAAVARHAPVSVLFKPSYDRRFTKMIENFRMVNGIKGICVADPWHLRAVRRALARNEVVGILLDQATARGIRISFLGQPASTSPIVAKLARRTHAPLLVGTIHRNGPCQHTISIHRLELEKIHYDLQKSTEMMSQALENAILRDPAQWVWSLDRWRSTGIELMSSVQRSI